MKIVNLILFFFSISICGNAQTSNNDFELIRKFDDAFSLLVSDNEKMCALITDNNKLEVYSLNPLKFIRRVKVTRNTWLNKGFFSLDNQSLYFDYGTQLKFKYRHLDIQTGKLKKVKCNEVPKGCSYKAIKICDHDNKRLSIADGDIYFEIKEFELFLFEKK